MNLENILWISAIIMVLLYILYLFIDYSIKNNFEKMQSKIKRSVSSVVGAESDFKEGFVGSDSEDKNESKNESKNERKERRRYEEVSRMDPYRRKWFLGSYPEGMTKEDYMDWLGHQDPVKLSYEHRRNQNLMRRGVEPEKVPEKRPPMHKPHTPTLILGNLFRGV